MHDENSAASVTRKAASLHENDGAATASAARSGDSSSSCAGPSPMYYRDRELEYALAAMARRRLGVQERVDELYKLYYDRPRGHGEKEIMIADALYDEMVVAELVHRARAGNYLDQDARKTVWPPETFHLQGPGSLHLGRARYPYTHIVCHDNPEIWLNDPFLNLVPEGEEYDLSPIAGFKISGTFKLCAPCEITWAEGQLSGDFTVKNWPDETPLFDPEYGLHGWLEHIW